MTSLAPCPGKRYLVGGAVRDALLGLPPGDRDWVVVGTTPEAMAAAGFQRVGRDFPVFLDPRTHEEHALARTERKSGRGYHGFQVQSGVEVTLEEDLLRRDLTVNAIAKDADGRLIDPYGGQADLAARVLRHVSPAFGEDPVRILRVARYAARFAPLGFRVADETLALMRRMVDDGEADTLVPERVWKETERALLLDRPSIFFETLRLCGALARVMPELDALHGVPQRADYHPEVDTLVHTLMCVDVAVRDGRAMPVRVAALLHDLGKALTPADVLPSHRGHDMRGLPPIREFCERLRVPNAHRDLALMVARDHLIIHNVRQLRPSTLLELIERCDGFRRGERFEQVLESCICDARGRLGFSDTDYVQAAFLRKARGIAAEIQAPEIVADGFSGPAVGEELSKRRIKRLADAQSRGELPRELAVH